MTSLFLLGHMDDETLSCGGLIQNRDSKKIRIVTLFGRKYNYGEGDQYKSEQVNNFFDACQILKCYNTMSLSLEEGEPSHIGYYKILKVIEEELAYFKPDEVIIPSEEDLNQDHRWIAECARIALRPANLGSVKRILAAHGIDGVLPKSVNWYQPLTIEQMEVKLKAMECYKRESRSLPHLRSPENLIAYQKIAGARCGEMLAEPYTLLYQKG